VRSTTFLFKALYTCSQFFGDIRVQTRAHRHIVGQSAAVLRAPERRPPRRPRPHATRAARLPHAPAPRGSSKSPRGHTRCHPRRTGRMRATDRRFVRGASPYARRSRPPYHGGISAVTATSPARRPTYKYRTFPPRTDTTAPPRHQRCRHRTAPPLLPTVVRPSLPLP
jgi:hypothetical protein